MMQKSLAAKLRLLRAQRGLTVKDAAGQLGIDRHTLRRIELGTQEAQYPTLAKIAEGYDVPVEDLLEEPEAALTGSPKDKAPSQAGPAQPDPSRPHTLEELLERAGIPGPYWLTKPDEEFESFWRGVSFEEARDRFSQIRREYLVVKEELENQVRGEPSRAPELQERIVSIYNAAFGRWFYALAVVPGKEESKGEFRAREQRGDTRPFREVVPGVPGAGDAIEDIVG